MDNIRLLREEKKRPKSILTYQVSKNLLLTELHSTLILDILLLDASTEAHAYRLTDVNVPLNSYILTSGNGALQSIWWYDDQGSGGR